MVVELGSQSLQDQGTVRISCIRFMTLIRLNPFKIRVPSELELEIHYVVKGSLNPFKIRVPSE